MGSFGQQVRIGTGILLTILLLSGCSLPTGPGKRVVVSSPHTLFRPISPGEGLRRSDKFLSIKNRPAELVWLTGASLSSNYPQSLPGPVLSRASVVFKNALYHNQLHGILQNPQGILFRFSPGVEEIRLPDGFGIPLNSNEPILLGTESQCQAELQKPEQAQFELQLDFMRQRGLDESFVPLYCIQLNSLITVGEKGLFYGVEDPSHLSGEGSPTWSPATSQRMPDPLGQVFADQWYQEPGEQTNHTLATRILALQRHTRLHHATAHMSTSGVSLELYDLTEGSSVIKLEREGEGPGYQQYSDSEGVQLYRDHEYELIAKFDNTSDRRVRSYAQMALYIHTPEFAIFPKEDS